MIFEGRPVNEISDEEIDGLVKEHVGERQHLEFKVTVNHKDDSDKLELLRDISSLANGGGGYLFVGIRDDGKGRAQKYEPDLVGDTQRIKKAMAHLSHDHISERIDGLEVLAREVKGNPLVIVRVPVSVRTPHMVTYNRRTDFYTRYHDGKREMTMGEIRDAFNLDMVGRRLSGIEGYLRSMTLARKLEKQRAEIFERLETETVPQFLAIEDGSLLADAATRRFEAEIGIDPYFRIAATPAHPNADLVDVDSESVQKLVRDPPGSRPNGWNMRTSYYLAERFAEGIRQGEKDSRYLEILSNGHMEFWAPLGDLFCWRQSPEEFRTQPRLYPYAVTEHPAAFLRLYRKLVDMLEINDDFLLDIYYRNLKGYVLLPHAPDTFWFRFPGSQVRRFEMQHLVVPRKTVSSDFQPDETAYDLVKTVYASFGLGEEAIPFYDKEEERFDFS